MNLDHPRTVVLKLSGEALLRPGDRVVSPSRLNIFAEQIARAVQDSPNLKVALVVGGGNIVRGKDLEGINHIVADQMGMLATVMNALAVKDALERCNAEARVLSALDTRGVAEPVVHGRVLKHLRMGRIVVFAGGLGQPGVTTDSAAAQRAWELDATALLVAKFGTDGIYDTDPRKNSGARKIDRLTYEYVLENRLEVMDSQAIDTCRRRGIPLFVFDMQDEDAIYRALTQVDASFGSWVVADAI